MATAYKINYKKMAIDRALHLREFLGFTIDKDVLVCSDGPITNKTFKFMDDAGRAAPLYVSGTTWKDVYMSLCAIEDAVAFTIEAGMED